MKLLFDKISKRIVLADRRCYLRLPDLRQVENKEKLSPIWKTKKRNSIIVKGSQSSMLENIEMKLKLKTKKINDKMYVVYFNKDSIGILFRKNYIVIFGRMPIYVLKGLSKLLLM